jgi:hypothetical protein
VLAQVEIEAGVTAPSRTPSSESLRAATPINEVEDESDGSDHGQRAHGRSAGHPPSAPARPGSRGPSRASASPASSTVSGTPLSGPPSTAARCESARSSGSRASAARRGLVVRVDSELSVGSHFSLPSATSEGTSVGSPSPVHSRPAAMTSRHSDGSDDEGDHYGSHMSLVAVHDDNLEDVLRM